MDSKRAAELQYWRECWCACQCATCGGKGWCECDDGDGGIYHKDGETLWEWCCRKHHWHCRQCKKILQIG